MNTTEALTGAIMLAIAFVALVGLHTPNGHVFEINPAEISSAREPLDLGRGRHWADGTHCVLVMTNGRFNAVAETCAEVESKMEQTK
jgi:hypothetical protein